MSELFTPKQNGRRMYTYPLSTCGVTPSLPPPSPPWPPAPSRLPHAPNRVQSLTYMPVSASKGKEPICSPSTYAYVYIIQSSLSVS